MDRLTQKAFGKLSPEVWARSCYACLVALLLAACSPKTTTPASRQWQAFITRYNTLYHAREAYLDTYQAALRTAADDYTLLLPFDPLTPAPETESRRPDFTRTLEKTRKAIAEHSMTRKPARSPGWRRDPRAVALQAKTEYNPALAEAWLLTLRSLFYSGRFEEARLTAESVLQRYTSEPEVREEARLWAVRALTHLGRPAEGEELLQLLPHEPSTAKLRARYLYPATRAELLLSLERWAEALPELRTAARLAPERKQRARLHFLLGQVALLLGRSTEARDAFDQASRLADQPSLELAAHLQALRLDGREGETLGTLRRLGSARRFRAEQDQIFLALGERLLRSGQAKAGEQALQRAIDSARQHRTPWAEAHLLLGQRALALDRYPEAHQHFTSALTVLPHRHPRYADVARLQPGLELLAPPAREVRRGDSLLRLGRLPEAERLRYIDSLIQAVRRGRRLASQPAAPSLASPSSVLPSTTTATGFYFDDPRQIEEGRKRFLQRWGDRPLTDDWNRSRRAFASAHPSSSSDSLSGSVLPEQPTAAGTSDSLSRSFYLQELPLTFEAQSTLREATAHALLQQADVLSEKLELLPHATRSYARLVSDFPDFTERPTALEKALLLALRASQRPLADSLRTLYLRDYPQRPLSRLLRSEDYPSALRQQAEAPERLYAAAWDDYRAGRLTEVLPRLDSLAGLPLLPSTLAPRADFLRLLAQVRPGEEARLTEELRTLQRRYPASSITPHIEGLLGGLEAGKKLTSLPFQDLPSSAFQAPTDSLPAPELEFLPLAPGEVPDLILLYPRGTQARHEAYFTLMNFAFSRFTQWSLEALPLEGFTAWEGFRLRGFPSAEGLQRFLREATAEGGLREALPVGALLLPLAPANLPLLRDETLPAYRQHLARASSPS